VNPTEPPPAGPVPAGTVPAGTVPAGTGPSRGLAWSPAHVPVQTQLSAPSAVEVDHGYWQIMIRSLIRAQLGLSLVCLAFALAVTASLPILCAVLPGLDRIEVFGLPLALVALGAGIYPVILIIGIFYNYQAGRLEQRFMSLADRVDGPADDADD
jgi:hypothetical protein